MVDGGFSVRDCEAQLAYWRQQLAYARERQREREQEPQAPPSQEDDRAFLARLWRQAQKL